MKRSLVISGGGSKGAFGGGIISYLIKEKHIEWKEFYGTSTGSLLITLSSLGMMNELKDAYTSITQDSIFSVNPFTKEGKVDILNAAWRVLRGKLSLGESGNLKKRLKEFYPEELFKLTLSEKKKLYACTTNFTTGQIKYFCNSMCNYETFINATIASTSVPLFMNPIEIEGNLFLDGGVLEHVPIQQAINNNADIIDVIILRTEEYKKASNTYNNMFKILLNTIDLMQREISLSDALIGQLEAKTKDVTLNIYYTPYNLTDNSLIFNKEQMLKWWAEGYEYAKVKTPTTLILKKSVV